MDRREGQDWSENGAGREEQPEGELRAVRTPVLEPEHPLGCGQKGWLAGQMAEDTENRGTWVSECELDMVASSTLLSLFLLRI